MVAVDICNLALGYLGDSATVASIDPPSGSAQSQHCARFYPIALNSMLEMYDWNFATQRISLAVVSQDYNGWLYAYAMPANTTQIISVLPAAAYGNYPTPYDYWPCQQLAWQTHSGRDFQVETIKGQQVILCNIADAVAKFTVSGVQPGLFPAQFADALAWRLAAMLAGPLMKGQEGAAESKRCLQAFGVIVGQAIEQDANQRHGSMQFVPSAIQARL